MFYKVLYTKGSRQQFFFIIQFKLQQLIQNHRPLPNFFINSTKALISKLLTQINPLSNRLVSVFYKTNSLSLSILYSSPYKGSFLQLLLSFFSLIVQSFLTPYIKGSFSTSFQSITSNYLQYQVGIFSLRSIKRLRDSLDKALLMLAILTTKIAVCFVLFYRALNNTTNTYTA